MDSLSRRYKGMIGLGIFGATTGIGCWVFNRYMPGMTFLIQAVTIPIFGYLLNCSFKYSASLALAQRAGLNVMIAVNGVLAGVAFILILAVFVGS